MAQARDAPSRIDAPGDTNLTTNSATDQSPAWSADGSQIAFVSDRDGRMDLWVMDRDGSGQHKVISGEAGSSDFEPTWSPDGERLAGPPAPADGPFTYNASHARYMKCGRPRSRWLKAVTRSCFRFATARATRPSSASRSSRRSTTRRC